MAARAVWKGRLHIGEIVVPVKLYSAVEDRHVHFRLLHEKDSAPVKQAMVNPDTEEVVPHDQTLRAYDTGEGEQVLFTQEELAQTKPDQSREIELLKFLPTQAIDHRWYDRPYYLGPDGSETDYAALTRALEESGKEGLAHWVMRNKEYYGALRIFRGYPMLMSLRYAEQVVSASELEPPKGKPLDQRELAMARQLIGMLESPFEPEDYQDEYRGRVLELIEKKRHGGRVSAPPRPKKEAPGDIAKALEASLKGVKHG